MNKSLIFDRNSHITLAIVLIASVLVWGTGLPFWIKYAHAATVTSFKDTITDSDLSVTADHAFAFTLVTTSTAGQTMEFRFDPTGDLFAISASATTTDVTATGMTVVTACAAGTDEVTVTFDTSAPNENLTLTVCAGDNVSPGAKTVNIGGSRVTNPGVAASYVISLSGSTMTDKGDTRVAIIDDVVVTASVDTTLTFVISAVSAGQVSGNEATATTTVTTTATTIPWGTLVPGIPKLASQSLAVTTNATNGFTVTVFQDQNLLSSTGASSNQ